MMSQSCCTSQWFSVALLISLCATTNAQEDADYQKVFDEVEKQNLQIKTGVFHAHGELKGNAKSGYPETGKLQFFCAFDFPANKLRFDRQLETREKLIRAEDGGGQFIRTGSETATFACNLDRIYIDSPMKKAPGWIKVIDIRAIGLAGYGDIIHSATFDRVLANYRKMPGGTINEQGDDLIRLEWIDADSLRACYLDKTKSYSVVRLTLTHTKIVAGKKQWDETPVEDHRITMAKQKDLWLPVGWESIDSTGAHMVEIEWESVNEPVNAKHFTFQDFDLKRAKQVIDSRSGRPIVVQELKAP